MIYLSARISYVVKITILVDYCMYECYTIAFYALGNGADQWTWTRDLLGQSNILTKSG